MEGTMEQKEKTPLEIIQECWKNGRGVKLTRRSREKKKDGEGNETPEIEARQTILKPGFRLVFKKNPPGDYMSESHSSPKTKKGMVYGETEDGSTFSASLDFITKAEEV